MASSGTLPSSQRAAHYNPPHALKSSVTQVAAVPPIPKSGIYTFVRVLSSSLNPVDYKLASLPQPLPRLLIGKAPITPGIDFVGRVWQTNHPDLKAGDLCWGMLGGSTQYGTCAEFTVHKGKDGILKVPDGFLPLLDQGRTLDELGAVGVAGLTAFNALKLGDLPYNQSQGKGKGGKVFINGASGGTGTFTVQMAKVMGCDTIVATCSSANMDLVKSLGATEVIDYRSQNVVEALKAWAQNSQGQMFDVIIDNVGSDPEIYWQAHHYLKNDGGKFVQVGLKPGIKDILELMKMSLMPGWLGGGKRNFHIFTIAGSKNEDWEVIGKWMVEGKLKTVIEDGNRFDLADIGNAFEKLHTGKDERQNCCEDC